MIHTLPPTSTTAAEERSGSQASDYDIVPANLLRQMLDAPVSSGPAPQAQVLTGHLDGIDEEGRLLFVPEQGPAGAYPVAIGVPLSDAVLVPAARKNQRALVVRTSETPPRFVLIGLVRERVAVDARDAHPGQLELNIDGETLKLTAEREIELSCGKASLILRESGRVILRGTYVVTSSSGPLKVKGATVDIN